MTHIPGHVGTTDTGGDAVSVGSSAIGLELFWPDGTFAGRLVLGRVPAFSGGERPLLLSIPGTQTEGAQITPFSGGTFLIPTGGGKAFSLSINSQGGISKSGTIDLDTGAGGGTSAPAFSSTQAAQTQAEEFQREQDRLDREFREEQNQLDRIEAERLAELQRKNAERLQAIGSLRSLAAQAGQIRNQFRTDLLGLEQASQVVLAQTLGQDPIRGAILGDLGGVQRGRTPSQAFRANVSTISEQAGTKAAELAAPLQQPNFEANIGGLESQIKQFTDLLDPGDLPSLPTAPVFGLEHGGEVVKAGKDESPVKPFSSRPDPMTAFRFADQMGLTPIIVGEREGGPELLLAAKGSKVIPLDDEEESLLVGRVQGAQEGFFEDFDFSTIEQALSPIFDHLGFSRAPIDRPGGVLTLVNQGLPAAPPGGDEFGGSSGFDATVRSRALSQLGVAPRLVKGLDSKTVFLLDNGVLRPFSLDVFQGLGLSFGDVLGLDQPSLDFLAPGGRGPAVTMADLPLIEPGVSERRFPLRSRPLTVDFPGGPNLVLPSARKLANIFRSLGADTRNVILSAFGVAGQGRESFFEEINFFTPKGTATRAGAAAFG